MLSESFWGLVTSKTLHFLFLFSSLHNMNAFFTSFYTAIFLMPTYLCQLNQSSQHNPSCLSAALGSLLKPCLGWILLRIVLTSPIRELKPDMIILYPQLPAPGHRRGAPAVVPSPYSCPRNITGCSLLISLAPIFSFCISLSSCSFPLQHKQALSSCVKQKIQTTFDSLWLSSSLFLLTVSSKLIESAAADLYDLDWI